VCPFFIESFAFDYLVPEVVALLQSLGRGRQVIRYDGRGTGLSDRDVQAVFGQTMLKGFDDAVRLYEVRWQE
jgi:hypothetical protein